MNTRATCQHASNQKETNSCDSALSTPITLTPLATLG